jgi:hypothetical protein
LRSGSGDAGSLLLLFTQHAGPHDSGAARLSRLFQLWADRAARIADFAAHAGAQLFHMRLLARLNNLLVRSGARRRKRSHDGECGAERHCEAAARIEPIEHTFSQRKGTTSHRGLILDGVCLVNKAEN